MAEITAFLAKWMWLAIGGMAAWIWKKQENEIKSLKDQAKDSISKSEAKEMIKEAVAPVREELGRFQQQMTETALLVKQISDNLNKLHTEFTVNVKVQEAISKLKEETKHDQA